MQTNAYDQSRKTAGTALCKSRLHTQRGSRHVEAGRELRAHSTNSSFPLARLQRATRRRGMFRPGTNQGPGPPAGNTIRGEKRITVSAPSSRREGAPDGAFRIWEERIVSDCASELRADRRTIPRAAARQFSSSGGWAARSFHRCTLEVSRWANLGVPRIRVGYASGRSPGSGA